jgi:hypothetical protein
MRKISDLFQSLLFLGSVALGTAFGIFAVLYFEGRLFSYSVAQVGGVIIGVIGFILIMLPDYFSYSNSPKMEEMEEQSNQEYPTGDG